MYCQQCGFEVTEKMGRCPRCGTAVPEPAAQAPWGDLPKVPVGAAQRPFSAPQSSVPSPPASSAAAWRLRVVQGGPPQAVFSLPDEALLGRQPDCTIVLPDSRASRHHARLQRRGNGWMLVDLGSRNGTLVNDRPVTQPVPLGAGDRIRIGDTVLVLESVGAGFAETVVQEAFGPPPVSTAPAASFAPPQPPQPGTAVPQSPPLSPAMPVNTAEIVLGILPGARRSSGFLGLKQQAFVIVITSHRLVFAHQTRQMQQDNIRRAKAEAKQQGGGFFNQWGAMFTANSGQPYMQMTPQQILSEQPANFFVMHDQVKQVRFKVRSSGADDSMDGYELHIRTTTEKLKLRFVTLNVGEARRLLQQVLGKRVR